MFVAKSGQSKSQRTPGNVISYESIFVPVLDLHNCFSDKDSSTTSVWVPFAVQTTPKQNCTLLRFPQMVLEVFQNFRTVSAGHMRNNSTGFFHNVQKKVGLTGLSHEIPSLPFCWERDRHQNLMILQTWCKIVDAWLVIRRQQSPEDCVGRDGPGH